MLSNDSTLGAQRCEVHLDGGAHFVALHAVVGDEVNVVVGPRQSVEQAPVGDQLMRNSNTC